MTRGMECVDNPEPNLVGCGYHEEVLRLRRLLLTRVEASRLDEANARLARLTEIASAILALPVRAAGIVVPVALRLELQKQFTEEPI